MGVPFQRPPEGVKDTNKSGNKVFGFVEGEEKVFNDLGNSFKETVKELTVFKEKMAEGIVNGENKVPVSTID